MMDIYPKLGKRFALENLEQAGPLVTEMWPTARQKDNFFWVNVHTDDPFIVAYIFEKKGHLYLRRAASLNTVVFTD